MNVFLFPVEKDEGDLSRGAFDSHDADNTYPSRAAKVNFARSCFNRGSRLELQLGVSDFQVECVKIEGFNALTDRSPRKIRVHSFVKYELAKIGFRCILICCVDRWGRWIAVDVINRKIRSRVYSER